MLICAISGEEINENEEAVLTPSGYICKNTLLLKKLEENGSQDPFTSNPLSETELTLIKRNNSQEAAPPRVAKHSSFHNLLNSAQQEYDALLLELFDTRRQLQETRKELSQALYENDAAVRVIARLSMERDMARQKKIQEETLEEPSQKKVKTASGVTASDVEILAAKWSELSKSRKKRVPSEYITLDQVKNLKEKFKKISLIKSNLKPGMTAMKSYAQFICVAGYDKRVILYDTKSASIIATLFNTELITMIDVLVDNTSQISILTASSNQVNYFSINSDQTEELSDVKPLTSVEISNEIQHICLHPTCLYCLVTSSNSITILKISKDELQILIQLSSSSDVVYNAAALHPDGLIYAVSNSIKNEIELWDLRKQAIGSNLQLDSTSKNDRSIVFSENGYHIAISSDNQIQLYDLRKLKCTATFLPEGQLFDFKFDLSGKYLASCASKNLTIYTVKDQSVVTEMELDSEDKYMLEWDKLFGKWMALSCLENDRFIKYYEANEGGKMEIDSK